VISVVILAYNSAHFVADTIDSILRDRLQARAEIIVVDNASSDDTYEQLKRRYWGTPGVTLVRNERSLGFAGGNNAAAKDASGDILLFLNDDCELEPGALQGILDDFAEDKALGVEQCGLASSDGTRWESLGYFIDLWGLLYEVANSTARVSKYPAPQQVFGAKGAAFAVRRETFQQLGGFDSSFGFLFEETDFCWRALLRGFKVAVSGRSVVRHKAMARYFGKYTGREGSAFYLLTRNRLSSMLKNFSVPTLATSIPVHCFLFFVYAARESIPNRPEVMSDFVRAIWWNVRRLPTTLALRKEVQRARVVSDRELITAGRIYRPSLTRIKQHPAMQANHLHI
jgi:GT2 family glycosyltransferase